MLNIAKVAKGGIYGVQLVKVARGALKKENNIKIHAYRLKTIQMVFFLKKGNISQKIRKLSIIYLYFFGGNSVDEIGSWGGGILI